jgi:hypothetical protein
VTLGRGRNDGMTSLQSDKLEIILELLVNFIGLVVDCEHYFFIFSVPDKLEEL